MLETGIGRAHNIALSTLENFSLPGDVSASRRYWKEDIIDPEVEVSSQGMIAIGDRPGTGYLVKEDLIEKLTVRKKRRCALDSRCADENRVNVGRLLLKSFGRMIGMRQFVLLGLQHLHGLSEGEAIRHFPEVAEDFVGHETQALRTAESFPVIFSFISVMPHAPSPTPKSPCCTMNSPP